MSQYTGDNNSYENAPTRDRLFTRWGQLKSERASWWAHYQELTTFILPRNGRYFTQDRDKGHRRHNAIYDNTGTRALRTLGAGMMAGATSPARPWFRLGTADPELNSYQPVKLWLDDVTKRMQLVFQRSNTYRALHGMYEELGTFGTAASIVLPDFTNVIHQYPVTCGEYCIATDYQGRVCTLYREFEGTVIDLFDKGAVISLPYGVEGFATPRHLVKEDGSHVKMDEKLEFKVIEFSKSAKRIILSHSRVYEDVKKTDESAKKKTATKPSAPKSVKTVKDTMEKTTLGDISELAALRTQMEENEKK